MKKWIFIILLVVSPLYGWAVDWDGGGVPNNSWENGTNWVGDVKPTSVQQAKWVMGFVNFDVYLNTNQVCNDLYIEGFSARKAVILRNTLGEHFTLTLTTGNIEIHKPTTRSSDIQFRVNTLLGDDHAVWTFNDGAHQVFVFSNITETVTNTTLELLGGLNMEFEAPIQITGDLWLRSGLFEFRPGSDMVTPGQPSHRTLFGDTSGTAIAIIRRPNNAPMYADIIVEAGSTGAKILQGYHSVQAANYVGDYLLNGDLTLGINRIACSGTFSGAGGLIKLGNNMATLTGALEYTGDTRINSGGTLNITGTMTNLGDFAVGGILWCGVTIDLAPNKVFEVENNGRFEPGKDVTITGDVILQSLAEVEFDLGTDTVRGRL
jgi:autotransporter-associated beta strand protein